MGLISTKDAANIVGVSQRRIQQFVQDGRVRAEKIGGVWLVQANDLERVKGLKNGRPKRKAAK